MKSISRVAGAWLALTPLGAAAHSIAVAHHHDFLSDVAFPAAIAGAVIWLAVGYARRLTDRTQTKD